MARNEKGKVGLRDVALDAGVALSTASHALNGTAPITSDVRERVLDAAARLGYLQARRTKAAIAALRTLILAVPADAAPQNDLNFVSWAVLSSLKHDCAQKGIRLVPVIGETKFLDGALIERVATEQGANGIICLNDDRPELVRRLFSANTPSVLLNGEDPSMSIDSVTAENRFGARLAVEHLLALGHRRIIHLSWKGRTTIARRFDGFVDAFNGAGFPISHDLIIEAAGYEPHHGEVAIREFLRSNPDLRGATAIFCTADNLAMGCLRELRRNNLQVPADVSVMGFDDIVPAEFSTPPLTTVRVPTDRLGAAAIGLLEQRVLSGDRSRPAHRLELGCSLVLRESVGNPRSVPAFADPC